MKIRIVVTSPGGAEKTSDGALALTGVSVMADGATNVRFAGVQDESHEIADMLITFTADEFKRIQESRAELAELAEMTDRLHRRPS